MTTPVDTVFSLLSAPVDDIVLFKKKVIAVADDDLIAGA
jgi:hypothetical protein